MSQCCPEETSQKTEDVEGCCGSNSAKDRVDYFLWTCIVLVLIFYIGALFFTGDHVLAVIASGVSELINKMWWGLALGVLFVGLLSKIPRELVMSVLGAKAGFRGLLRATQAGLLLDLCSHGILMVGMKLYERGASLGQLMAFLIASPWNSLSLTLILIALIGLGWTLVFIALSLVIALISGMIFERLVDKGVLPDNPHRVGLDKSVGFVVLWREFRKQISFSASGCQDVLVEGVRGSKVVFRWALFGVLLASVIRVLMPQDMFATLFGATFAGLMLTLGAATIIEVCSEGSTPIAADLMTRAAAPGNSFTFLMAGVSTDYTEVMSIRDTTKSWKIALFLPLVTLPQVLVLGYLLNQFSL